MRRMFYLLLIFVVSFYVYSCGDAGEAIYRESTLIKAEAVGSIDKETVLTLLQQSQEDNNPQPVSLALQTPQAFGIKVFKVSYWTTDEQGNRVKASGIMFLPDVNSIDDPNLRSVFSYPLISDQHGTIFSNQKAPSFAVKYGDIPAIENGATYYDLSPYMQVAVYYTGQMGFGVVMPDYIGYGDSVDHYHPYMLSNSLANSAIDLIKAAIEYGEKNGEPVKREVYLAGYSEGGYATLATAKKLQETNPFFTVKAVFPMDGIYNLETFALALLNINAISFPPFMAYVVDAYSKTYSDVIPSQILISPFDEKLSVYFDKTKDGKTIYQQMVTDYYQRYGQTPSTPFKANELFQGDMISDFVQNPENPFRARLRQNNVDNWIPQMPVIFIHCGQDDVLFYGLVEKTYNNLLSAGADVDLIDPEDYFSINYSDGSLKHSQCAPYAYKVLFIKLCQMELAPKGVTCPTLENH